MRFGKKFKLVVLSAPLVIGISLISVFAIDNPIGGYIIAEAKANGYVDYTPDEAHDLALKICTQCHTTERIKLYCPRCGPPFVAVVPHMQTFIDNYKLTKPDLEFNNITEHQAVAIVQVWNALIGNWESDFREQDMLKLIGHYDKLKALYLTPVDKRRIEFALSNRDDMKIGHMSGLEEAQRNLGKPENNPQNPCMQKPSEPKHMDHGDHQQSEHKQMDHSTP